MMLHQYTFFIRHGNCFHEQLLLFDVCDKILKQIFYMH